MTRRTLYQLSMTLNLVGMGLSLYAESTGWFCYNAFWFAVTALLLPPAPAPAESPRS